MKTLILFTINNHEPCFFELKGDYSRFNGIYINNDTHLKLENELNSIIFDEITGSFKLDLLEKPTRDWNYFVKCGFLLYI